MSDCFGKYILFGFNEQHFSCKCNPDKYLHTRPQYWHGCFANGITWLYLCVLFRSNERWSFLCDCSSRRVLNVEPQHVHTQLYVTDLCDICRPLSGFFWHILDTWLPKRYPCSNDSPRYLQICNFISVVYITRRATNCSPPCQTWRAPLAGHPKTRYASSLLYQSELPTA